MAILLFGSFVKQKNGSLKTGPRIKRREAADNFSPMANPPVGGDALGNPLKAMLNALKGQVNLFINCPFRAKKYLSFLTQRVSRYKSGLRWAEIIWAFSPKNRKGTLSVNYFCFYFCVSNKNHINNSNCKTR
ncbi:MAG: hypothetical protein AB7S72_13635 [Draconibacterium sp.]